MRQGLQDASHRTPGQLKHPLRALPLEKHVPALGAMCRQALPPPTLPQAFCCAQVKPPGGVTSEQAAEEGPCCAPGWLQRPHVAAHQPCAVIQLAPHCPHSFFWEHVEPSEGRGAHTQRCGQQS